MNAFQIIEPIKSDIPNTSDLLSALLKDLGCRVGNMPDNQDGNKAYSNKFEFFNPFKVCSIEEYQELPEHWQSIFRNQNAECWNCKYTYVHSPVGILVRYPRSHVAGIFVVINGERNAQKIKLDNLMHTGGQFTEYDTKDKCIWMNWIESNAEDDNNIS